MPTKTSGRAAMNDRRSRPSNRTKRGKSRRISKRPITASDSDGSHAAHPAARILGPATPKNSASGASRRSAWIKPAPSVSPDASPATRPTRSGMRFLSNDAARAASDEIDERPDLFLSDGRLVEFLQCGLQFEARAVEHAIGPAHVANLIVAEAAPLQTHRIDAVRLRGLPHGHHIRRHIPGHGGIVGDEAI